MGRVSVIGLVALLIAALTGGCAHTPDFTPSHNMCDVPKTYLEVEAHDDPTQLDFGKPNAKLLPVPA